MFITLLLSYLIDNLRSFHVPFEAYFYLPGMVINILLIYFINKQKNKDLSHFFMVYINFGSFLYGLAEFLQIFFSNEVTAYFFLSFGNLGYLMAPISLFLFSLAYSKNFGLLKNKLLYFYITVGGAVLFVMGNATDLINPRWLFSYDPYQGAVPVLSNALTNFGLIPFDTLFGLGSIIVFFIYLRKLKDDSLRNQLVFLVTGCLISFSVGLFLLFGLRQLWNPTYVNVVPFVFTGFCVTFFIDMVRYKLLIVNPAIVADNIINSMNEMIFIFNISNMQLEYVNDTAVANLRYSKNDLLNKPFNTVIEGTPETIDNYLFTPLRKGRPVDDLEVELLSNTGERIPVSISAKPYRGSGKAYPLIIAIATDISKLKELSMAKSEQQKLNTVIESINDGILALDLEGKVLIANSRAVSLLKLPREDLVGNLINRSVILKTRYNEELNLAEILPSQQPAEDTRILYHDEAVIYYRYNPSYVILTAASIKEGYKAGLGSIITLLDVNEAKQLEQMEYDFIYMTVHDLRTPLSMLRADILTLINNYLQFYDEDGRKLLLNLNGFTERMMRTVENLFTVIKIEKGKLEMEFKAADLVSIIAQAVDKMADKLSSKKINLNFRPPFKIPLS